MKAASSVVALALGAVFFLVACTSDGKESQVLSPTAGAELTATSQPDVVATAPPAPLPPSGIALFDIRSGSRTMIPATQPQASAEFGLGDSITVFDAPGRKTYDFGGREVTAPVVNARTFTCEVVNGSAVVIGRAYPGVPSCGPGVSPDISGTWMLYSVPVADVTVGGRTFSAWDQWALNRHTDERRLLQPGLVHCGGCDGRFGPAWSSDGRFVYFSDLAGPMRTFLSDMQGGTTGILWEGNVEVGAAPSWLAANTLLYRSTTGAVVLENFGAGTRAELAALQ